MAKYLDETGLKTLWSKIKGWTAANVGGRNLIKGTSMSTVWTFTYPTSGYNDKKAFVTTTSLDGTVYTLSFWAKSTVAGDKIRTHFYDPNTTTEVYVDGTKFGTASDGLADITLTTSWKKYRITYYQSATNKTKRVICPRMLSGAGTGTVSMKGVKFEEGEVATDWSPAPEDTVASATTASTCSGNSATTTKLKTAINVNTSDSAGTNSGDSVSFDGSSDITIPLPRTIEASLQGNATSATNADQLDGYEASGLLTSVTNENNKLSVAVGGTTKTVDSIPLHGSKKGQFKQGNYVKILSFTTPAYSLSPTITFTLQPTECQREQWDEYNISIRSRSILFYALRKGTATHTIYCVTESTTTDVDTYGVYIKVDKNNWDGFTAVQVTHSFGCTIIDPSVCSYVDALPSGTCVAATATGAVAKLANKRTLTVGNTGKTFDGSGDVSWSLSEIGAVPLNSSNQIDSKYLPSYVDDVLEYEGKDNFPASGEGGIIYVDTSTNLTYRWSGTAYVEISPSLALGETSSTAYAGDKGKTAYDHSQLTSGNPHKVTKSDVGLGNVDNTADANKSVKYAASAGSATQVNNSLTIKLNSGDTEGTSKFTFNGSAAKSVNITPSAIGAAASSHTHTKSQITDFPTSIKNPNALTAFGVSYDGSATKTVDKTTFVGTLAEGTSNVTDGTMFITSYASDNGFADTNAVNTPYKRKASCLYNYIKGKTDTEYVTEVNTSGDYLTYKKNGTTVNLGIPNADKLDGKHWSDIKIGGRNYYKHSSGCGISNGTGTGIKSTDIHGYYATPSSSGLLRISNLGFNGVVSSWTVSCYLKASVELTANVNLCDVTASTTYNEASSVKLTTEYVKHTFTFLNVAQYHTTDNYNGFLDIETSTTTATIYVKDIKIERGTIATDWCLAPEDAIDATAGIAVTYDDGAQATLRNTAPLYFVNGTQTTATGNWTGDLPEGVLAYYNGLTIRYRLSAAPSGNASLQLGSLASCPVLRNTNSRVTTHYGSGSILTMTYYDGNWYVYDYDSTDYDTVRMSAAYLIAGADIYYGTLVRIGQDGKAYPICTTRKGKPDVMATGVTYDTNICLGDVIYSYAGANKTAGNALQTYCLYECRTMDLRYVDNCVNVTYNASTNTLGLQIGKPVYIKVSNTTTDSNGNTVYQNGWYPVAQTTTGVYNGVKTYARCWTQTEFTDGGYYMYLGIAYNNYSLYLSAQHKIFCYNGSELTETTSVNTLEDIVLTSDNTNMQEIVDSLQEGIVAKADKSTTLAGYGITDGLRAVTKPTGSNVFVTGISTDGTNITYTKSYTKKSLTSVGTSGWSNATTDSQIIPDMSFIAYWNGAYSGTSSNLSYCNKGAFGSFATKSSLAFSELTNKPTSLSGYSITDGVNAVTTSGSGNAITGASISGHTLTLSKGTFLTSHQDITGKLDKSGGTMTGVLTVLANQYTDAYNGALNMNNSDIYGLNSIYTADKSDSQAEGIHFWRSDTTVDTFRMVDGKMLFTPNRTLGGTSTEYTVLHSGNYSSYASTNTALTNENLNNVTTPGFYNAGGGNTCTNKPADVNHFGLMVIHNASGSYYTQILTNDTKTYGRTCINGTWNSWVELKYTDTHCGYCNTASATAAKVVYYPNYVARTGNVFIFTLANANTYAGQITLNVNSTGAKNVVLNGGTMSSSLYSIPAGNYLVYYDGTNYHINNNSTIPITVSSADSASRVTGSLSWSGYSSGSYDGSTAKSFVIPNNTNQLTNGAGFTTNTGTVTSVAVKMNGTTKGTITTSGTIDLGTVLTAHQSLSNYLTKAMAANTYGNKVSKNGDTINGSLFIADTVDSDGNVTTGTLDVSGDIKCGDTLFADTVDCGNIETNILKIPTTSGGSTYGVGTNGQVLKSNGSTVYWANDNNTVYTLPSATSSTLGGVKIGSNITVSSGTISLTKANVTSALGYTPPTTNTTYSVATTSTNGLMSTTDRATFNNLQGKTYFDRQFTASVQYQPLFQVTLGTISLGGKNPSCPGIIEFEVEVLGNTYITATYRGILYVPASTDVTPTITWFVKSYQSDAYKNAITNLIYDRTNNRLLFQVDSSSAYLTAMYTKTIIYRADHCTVAAATATTVGSSVTSFSL